MRERAGECQLDTAMGKVQHFDLRRTVATRQKHIFDHPLPDIVSQTQFPPVICRKRRRMNEG
jgi:hypothetical protein